MRAAAASNGIGWNVSTIQWYRSSRACVEERIFCMQAVRKFGERDGADRGRISMGSHRVGGIVDHHRRVQQQAFMSCAA